jgi:hypothetical protein
MATNSERLAECKLRYEGSVYPTNLHGDILVLEYQNKKNVTVKFLKSGKITTAHMTNIKSGVVREPSVEVGDIFETNLNGKLEVVNYKSALEVTVRFLNTGYETTVEASQIRTGEVRDWVLPKAFGIGVMEDVDISLRDAYPKHKQLWQNMLSRCYNNNTTYVGKYESCSVSDHFLHFKNFRLWCDDQVGFNEKDNKGKAFALDKDVLIKGNLLYSENTCCFVPREINNLLLTSKRVRGDLPIGVQRTKTKVVRFLATLSKNGTPRKLGVYNTPEEAFLAYKQAKEAYIKDAANKWKDKIDPRAYNALMNYQVEITD